MILALVLAASAPVAAAPKGKEAKALFDRGVAAYTKKDYPGASEAFGKSFDAEADVETLYAWAQSERQLDHCEKAIELYQKILKFDLPDENRKAVVDKLDECKALVVVTKPEPTPTPEAKPEPVPAKPVIVEPPEHPGKSAWWKDPIGGVLVVGGVAGIGIGGYFLASANSASSDAKASTNYFEVERLNDKADKNGRFGVIAVGAGAALLVGGIVRYAMHGGSSEHTTVTGWVSPDSAGAMAFGRF